MKNRFRMLCVLIILSLVNLSIADMNTSKVDDIFTKYTVTQKDNMSSVTSQSDIHNAASFRFLQEENKLYIIMLIMVLTPIFLVIILFFISRSGAYTSDSIVNGSGLVLVIQATILVVMAAATSEQLTAAIGVVGAVAGYLFGSATSSSKASTKV